jgi:hypothetical protein
MIDRCINAADSEVKLSAAYVQRLASNRDRNEEKARDDMTRPQQPQRPGGRRADRRKTRGHRGHQERQISVRAVRRDPPDLRKLSRAIIAIAIAEAQAEAEAEAQAQADAATAVPQAEANHNHHDQGDTASRTGTNDAQ